MISNEIGSNGLLPLDEWWWLRLPVFLRCCFFFLLLLLLISLLVVDFECFRTAIIGRLLVESTIESSSTSWAGNDETLSNTTIKDSTSKIQMELSIRIFPFQTMSVDLINRGNQHQQVKFNCDISLFFVFLLLNFFETIREKNKTNCRFWKKTWAWFWCV